jgi:predicted lipoprotein with Yx(FWY)xxD motif
MVGQCAPVRGLIPIDETLAQLAGNKLRPRVFTRMQVFSCYCDKGQTMNRIKLAIAGLAVVVAGCADMGGAPMKYAGGVIASGDGMTLYTFDKDVAGSGKSVCNGPCAKNWPPYKDGVDGTSGGDWTIITRDDGTKQWAYAGKPVYLWNKDQKPGDKTGDGVNGVWHALKVEFQVPVSR